jgi:hypothetical protein
MPKPVIKVKAKEPATLAGIQAFETLVGNPLPAVYREFLLKTNGGRPKPFQFQYLSRKSGKLTESGVDTFFHLGKGDSNLQGEFQRCTKDNILPKGYLPIAYDSFGDLICLALIGKDQGAVKWIPMDLGMLEYCQDGYMTEDTARLIAPTWDDFLESFGEF